jgi:fatty acid desaturase
LTHEYYVHSKTAYSYLASIASLITPFSTRLYKKNHIAHHKHFPNTPGDPDITTNKRKTSLDKILGFTILENIFLLSMRKKKLGLHATAINKALNKQ